MGGYINEKNRWNYFLVSDNPSHFGFHSISVKRQGERANDSRWEGVKCLKNEKGYARKKKWKKDREIYLKKRGNNWEVCIEKKEIFKVLYIY